MIPNQQWMAHTFDVYNRKYFGGQLPTPQFKVGCPEGQWGRFEIRGSFNKFTRKITNIEGNGTLMLTNKYSRAERSVIGTMLHEMIHEYIYIVKRIYPRNGHGQEFMEVANRINADGWNISEANEVLNTDILGGKDDVENILCIVEKPQGNDFKYWVAVVSDGNKISEYAAAGTKVEGVTNVRFYKCITSSPILLQSTPSDFNGFGGMSQNEAIMKLSKWSGVKIENIAPLK